jgi:hypothetical protein
MGDVSVLTMLRFCDQDPDLFPFCEKNYKKFDLLFERLKMDIQVA